MKSFPDRPRLTNNHPRLLTALFLCLLLAPSLQAQEEGGEPGFEIPLTHKVQGNILQADVLQQRVLKYYEDKYGYNSLETLKYIEALAWMNMELQDYDNAQTYYERALDIREHKMSPSPENAKEIHVGYFNLGDAYLFRAMYDEALAQYDKSAANTIDPAAIGDILSRKAITYRGKGEPEEAIETYLKAVDKYRLSLNRSPEKSDLLNKRLLVAYNGIIEIYKEMGEDEEVYKEYTDLRNVFKNRVEGVE